MGARVTFDLKQVLDDRAGQNLELYAKNLNPQLARVLRTIGFDRNYVRGEGCYLWDDQGDRYLDMLAGFGVFALGRSHPAIKSALHQAIDLDLPNLVQIDTPLLAGVLAEELLKRTHPGMGRVFFCNSGAESVEAAVKFARSATKRKRVIFADHGYHGLTYGALSANGGTEFRKGFGPFVPGFDQVPFGDAEALGRELKKRDVAALLIEPIQGKGVNVAPQAYWDAVQELCTSTGTLLIADEVQTGMGRTGRLWAHEHWGLVPDIITTSKALSGGFVPIAAMICSTEISDSVYSSMERALVHSTTFKNNALAMVAGLATLQTFDDEGIVEHVRVTGEAFTKALEPLVDKYELFHEVRGEGLMIGLVFGEPKSRAVRSRFRLLELAHKGLFSQLIVVPLFQRHRILTQVAADGVNVVKLLPPLIAGQDEIDAFVSAFDDVLAAAHRSSSLVDLATTMAKGALRRDR